VTGRFTGKLVLVTGAAAGLGRATAARFAAGGARIFGVDVDARGLEQTRAVCAPGAFEPWVADLRSAAACREVVAAAVAAGGGLDVLCNVAGINRFHHFLEMPEEEWQLILAVNLGAVAFLCQAALPHLIERRGCIVNVGSVASLKGQPYTAAYSASKGGLALLTRSLAIEFAETGVRINAIAPGGMETPMNQKLQFPPGIDWKKLQPLIGPGIAPPEQVADVIVFLASDEAARVHGAIWSVDGGASAG
jgi:meso-butanediol dehydrogenase / (S,S)-butanediol dehydrogenase / diacetyl reductase